MNNGKIQKFYIEDDHEAIIDTWIWKCVQLEIARRKQYLEQYGTNSYSNNTESNPFASKVICGCCNKVFGRKVWRSSTGIDRKVWQCSERYKVKGVVGGENRHVDESTLERAFVMAWNGILESREYFIKKWGVQKQSENLLVRYRAMVFMESVTGADLIQKMDTDLVLKILDYIKVFEDGALKVVFLDGTEIECRSEEV